MDENKTAVIVFGGGSTGLGVIRSLGRRGVPVIAADYNKHSLAFSSKYVRERIILPGPEAPNDTVTLLLEKADRLKNSVLIAADDYLLTTLSRNKAKLSSEYIVSSAGWDVIEKCLNKGITYRASLAAGVPSPWSMFPDSVDFLEIHQDEFRYPCILKPVSGHKLGEVYHVKAFRSNNFKELQYYYRLASELQEDVMIQDMIPGGDDQLYAYYSYRDSEGNTLAEFTCRKTRQAPPSFGVMTFGESTYTPEIMELGRRLLSELEYTGVCSIEFKRDSRDNQFKLIEINARFTTTISLATESGLDFPWVMYQDLVNKERVIRTDYSTGLKWVHFSMDLSAFLRYYREGYKFRDFIKSYRGQKTYAIFIRDDPKPLFKEWTFLLYQLPSFLLRFLRDKKL